MDDTDLIEKYKSTNDLFHLSKTPINENNLMAKSPQLLAMGYNVGGRPDGLWMSQGGVWLGKTNEIKDSNFPTCCYIYKIFIPDEKMAKIKIINTDDEFDEFDREFSAKGDNYWLNLDYFTLDFTDYMTNLQIYSRKKCVLNLCKLKRLPGESIWDVLIKNKIIFADAKSALNGCEFFKHANIDIERFKYKNWARIAKKYDGIIFSNWTLKSNAQKYFWFQSLDIPSGCLWNTENVSLQLLHEKKDLKWQ